MVSALKIAVPKVSLDRIESARGRIVWIPMTNISYRTGGRKFRMCFDAFTPVKLRMPEAFVWFMRNPKHFSVRTESTVYGNILSPLIGGEKIIMTLKKIKETTLEVVKEVEDTLIRMQKRYLLHALSIIPAQYTESKKLKKYEKWISIYTLLDAANIDFDTEYLSEELIYWPLLIDTKENIVYELALKLKPSRSYSEVHQKYRLDLVYGLCERNV